MNTYNIITIGCQMNKSDSERMAGHLEEQGMRNVDNKYQADVVILVTCGVRQSAEDRIYGIVPRIKKENPGCKIVFTGCLSEREDIKKKLNKYVDLWMPISRLSDLSFRISDQRNDQLSRDNCSYLEHEAKHMSKISAYVPIGNGCNNFCSYCVVPYARGREKYRNAEDVIKEVKELVGRGYKEINLIAQNVNSYQSKSVSINANKNIDFPMLLKLINNIQGNFWIRFATSHPKDMSDELIKAIAECDTSAKLGTGKICEHIHLPVQAGDDEILKAMNRKYTVGHYKNLIKKIRSEIPNASISTDIIVGFPEESREQFENTLNMAKEIKFDQIYIAQYSPRPQTAAAKLKDDVSKEEKKKREQELTRILKQTALENNKRYLGQEVEVLVEGKNRKGDYYGKTSTGKSTELGVRDQKLGSMDLTGKFVKVKIFEAKEFGLKGELIV